MNSRFAGESEPIAHAESAGAVRVDLPKIYSNRSVEFVAEMENLTIESDRRQKVVINEKTGTIVLGKDVRLAPVAILHGVLSVEIRTQLEVSQPEPLSKGQTTVTPATTVNAKEEKAKNVTLQKGSTMVKTWCAPHASHRLRPPRHHRNPASHANRRCPRRRHRSDLMTTSPIVGAGAPVLDTPEPKPKTAEEAAKAFESLLIAQMLQEFKGDDDQQDSTGSTMLDVANQQFAKMISDKGGFGLSQTSIDTASRRQNRQVSKSLAVQVANLRRIAQSANLNKAPILINPMS